MSLRVAFVYHWPEQAGASVVGKALEQLRTWRALGAEAEMFALSRQAEVPEEAAGLEHVTFLCGTGRRERFLKPAAFAARILAFRPDVVYARFATWYPYLEVLARRCPTVLELNTDDRAELAVTAGRLTRLFHNITRRRLLEPAAGFVAMTHEITERVFDASQRRRAIVIPNGIKLDSIAPAPPVCNERPRLIFIGTPGLPWHGLDQLVAFAEARPALDVGIIGSTAGDLGDRLPPNVACYGFLRPDAYRAIIERADVAVGTLALHRKRMEEACPLKVREYLARGLPTIIGYKDVDFPGDVDFLLEIPNRAGAVVERLDEVDRFITRWSGQRVSRDLIRHLDTSFKERERLDFLSEVVDRWRRR